MNLAWWSEHPFEFPLLLLTAVVTHLLMSFSQTLMHYVLGHRRLGGMFYRNHIHYHHVNYPKDHLVSLAYIKNHDDGNNTPFFMIPVALMFSATYFLFPLGIFLTQIITALVSFCAHVYLDNQYHIVGSPLLRFAWFRRKQQHHFVHHIHGDSNFAIIDYFWDRLLGTYRNPDADNVESGMAFPHQIAGSDRQAGVPVAPPSLARSGGSGAGPRLKHGRTAVRM
jgi:sterol desaturase/sphingolipid hydroxylase (fatty acid hydroxylase superfamily)